MTLEQLVAGGDALRELGVDLDLGGEVGLELVEGVELRGQLGELVVELGQLALLDRGDGHGADGLLALAVTTGERGGEGLGLVGRHADEGLVETVEHVLAADLVGDAGDLVDVLALDLGGQVDRHEVAVLHGALDTLEGAEAGAQVVETLLHGLVLDRGLVDRELDVGEVGQVDLGTRVDLGGEAQVVTVGGGHRQVGDLGLAERAHRVLLDGLTVEGRQCVVDGLLEHGGTADTLLDDAGGHLALAEAGDLDVLTDVLDGCVEARLELLERDLDGHLDPGRAEGLERTLHCGYSIGWCRRGRRR